MNKNRNRILIPVIGVSLFVLVVCIRMLWDGNAEDKKKGIEYLKRLEAKDVEAIERDVKEIREEARVKAMEEGELPVWAQFNDYVIFGDSRTVGFSFHEFLDGQRIMADGGLTIEDIPTYLDEMKTLNPAHLFLCTGLNDVSIGFWPAPEEYVAAYDETVTMLMKELPDTHIYINSIFPAQDPAFEQSSLWRNIPDYNQAVMNWCKEKGYTYIDNTEVFEAHKDLYDEDGIHFQKEFYEYWAINMLAEVEM